MIFRFTLLFLLNSLCTACKDGSGLTPPPESIPVPVITIQTQHIILETSDKTTATIQFTTLKDWYIVVNNANKAVSWIAVGDTLGKAGSAAIMIQITEPNPSSLTNREARLKIISDTAFRVVSITQPARANTDIAVTSVELDKNQLRLVVGTAETLTVSVLPNNATNKSVSWSSSDQGVATVSPTGVVSGVKNGNAIITATTLDSDKMAQCCVTVMTVPESGGQINDWN